MSSQPGVAPVPDRSCTPLSGGARFVASAALMALLATAARAGSEIRLVNDEVRLRAPASCGAPAPAALSRPRWDVSEETILPGRILLALADPPPGAARVTGRDPDGCALTGIAALDAISHLVGLRAVGPLVAGRGRGPLDGALRLDFDPSVDPRSLARAMSGEPGVLWAEPDHLRAAEAVPSDSSWSLQWNMPAVRAPEAWDLGTGHPGAVIAIIDTGVQLDHPDLSDKLWVNQAEGAGAQGIDDDGNGFVDDLHGWDFVGVSPFLVAQGEDPGPPDRLPTDAMGHGTSVAGVAAAAANNVSGQFSNVAGACWGCSIMAVRAGYKDAFSGSGVVSSSASAAAIVYAADNGAHIVNMSYSGSSLSLAEEAAVAYAVARGVLPVAAAGNIRDPLEADLPVYPAALPGVVAVAATDRFDSKALFSKYGTYVDLAAPGLQILTTDRGSGYGFFDGTSFSAPLVAGVAGLALSSRGDLEGVDLESLLGASAVDIDARNLPYQGLLGEGRLDAFGAMVAHRIAITNEVTDPNSPSAAFTVTGISLDAAAPWLDFGFQAPMAIAPGETLFIEAIVDEPSAACGSNSAEVTVLTDSPGAGTIAVPVILNLDCDGDDDGYICDARGGPDCDDASRAISPGGEEICDGSYVCLGAAGTDENCDGQVDEICSCAGKPFAPEIISVVALDGPAVRLAWKDLSNNEKAFKVHRRKLPRGDWIKVARLPRDTVSFVDAGVKRATVYRYRITAVGKGGGGGKAFTGDIPVP